MRIEIRYNCYIHESTMIEHEIKARRRIYKLLKTKIQLKEDDDEVEEKKKKNKKNKK